ncbi:MAG: hypothetical protein LAN36_15765, partial [Acidobacteriia bacterium]|nr:hypothetical protein [Terriglobia bacterium]
SEMSPLSRSDEPYLTEDPYVNALAAYALDRLAELEDEASWRLPAAGLGDSAAAWRDGAARIRAALPTSNSLPQSADFGRSWTRNLAPGDQLDAASLPRLILGFRMNRRASVSQ